MFSLFQCQALVDVIGGTVYCLVHPGPIVLSADILLLDLRIVNIKGDTKPADRCDVETLKGASVKKNVSFFDFLKLISRT